MKYHIVIGVILITGACAEHIEGYPEPENLIPRDEMIELLTDMAKLEAHIQSTYLRVDRFHEVMVASGDSLLLARGIQPDVYEESMDYYATRHEEMNRMYAEVLDRLNKESGELEAN